MTLKDKKGFKEIAWRMRIQRIGNYVTVSGIAQVFSIYIAGE